MECTKFHRNSEQTESKLYLKKKSLINDIKSLLNTSLKPPSKSSLSSELDKFSEIGSPHNSENNQSINVYSKSLKTIISENYEDYISRIKEAYPTFKFNHYYKTSEKYKINKFSNITSSSEINSEKDFTYVNSKILENLKISKDFLVEEDEYKINKNILEKSISDTQNDIFNYMEKTGMIEADLNYILSNYSVMIYNYIEKNFDLQKQVDFFLNKVQKYKTYKETVKNYYFKNTNKILLSQSRKNNLIKTKDICHKIFNLNNLISQLKTNSFLGEAQERGLKENSLLINQTKSLLEELQNLNTNSDYFYLIYLLEKELENILKSNSKKSHEEFLKNLNLIFSNSLILNELIVFDNVRLFKNSLDK
jgi:hypothetical protein